MIYEVFYSEAALKEIQQIPAKDAKKIYLKTEELGNNPRPKGYKKLEASKENMLRIRVGDYRILYTVEDTLEVVDIRRIGHRKDVYKK